MRTTNPMDNEITVAIDLALNTWVADTTGPGFAVSVGLINWSAEQSFDVALKQADAAMYQHKNT